MDDDGDSSTSLESVVTIKFEGRYLADISRTEQRRLWKFLMISYLKNNAWSKIKRIK